MEDDDPFVDQILGTKFRISLDEEMAQIEGRPPTPQSKYDTMEDPEQLRQSEHVIQQAQILFRYALIFINFVFIVASILMIAAGIVARENSAVKLCGACNDLTMVTIVFGMGLWLLAMFGFNWIRQRNILFLLVYVFFLMILALVLFGVVVAAAVFDRGVAGQTSSKSDFLHQWIENVQENSTWVGRYSPICELQRQFNCSGFEFGCCAGFNESDPDASSCYGSYNNRTEPEWVSKVCPRCPIPSAPQICTSVVYSAVRRNLSGFLLIVCFSMFLVLTGVWMTFLVRKINQSK